MPAIHSLKFPVVVLAGGLGTRLRTITGDRWPKPMVPVAFRRATAPFLSFVLEHVRAQGCTEITMCVGHLGESIRGYYGDGRRFGLSIRYDDLGPTAGTAARVISAALGLASDAFLVVCGDTYHPLDLNAFNGDFLAHSGSQMQLSVIASAEGTPTNVAVDDNGTVVGYKASGVVGPRVGIETGTLAVRKAALAGMPHDPALSLTEHVYRELIRTRAMRARYDDAPFFDIGTPEGYHRFCSFAAAGRAVPIGSSR